MDWSHFGLIRRPFRPAVDTASYFSAAAHEAALCAVAAAFDRRDPVALIDGPPGIGKSLVARRWLEQLPADVTRVVVPNPHAPRAVDLLQAILFDLNEPYQGLSEQELRLAVTAQLLASAGRGHPTVLLIDEAQHLSTAALEELRLLGNVETQGGSALFTLLVALPEFRNAISRPEYAAFAQRVGCRCRLEPLTGDESAAYLRHQVTAGGGNPAKVFDSHAIALLAEACGGTPRVLNQAAGLAAELTVGADAAQIDVEAALEALAQLSLAPDTEEPAEPVVLRHPAGPDKGAAPERAKATGAHGPASSDEPRAARVTKQKAARKRSA